MSKLQSIQSNTLSNDHHCLYKRHICCKMMLLNNEGADNYTYPILVQAMGSRGYVFEGRQVHNHVVKVGFEVDVYVKNTLISMYVGCGRVRDARKVFDGSGVRDLVSWNSMLAGYVMMGDVNEAKVMYDSMPERNVIASNSMIVLLGRCGRLSEARRLFDEVGAKDLVSWTALISCYEQSGMYEEALTMFAEMNCCGIGMDEVVLVSVLSACTHLSIVKTGEMIHRLSLRIGIDSYVNLQNALIHMYSTCGNILAAENLFKVSCQLDQISWNSMISGYLKCGKSDKARELFDSMTEKDIVTWSAMISGYAQLGLFAETLTLFQMMLHQEVRPDEVTFVSVISACTHLAALSQGKWVHAYIRKNGFKINALLGTTLVDMYMKCGCVKNAQEVFLGMEEKGVSSWNALILGLAMNGVVEKSLETFSVMKKCGVEPNEITFVSVLSACRHMGLVEEGRSHFESMIQKHGIAPNIKHYGCMVDLLGRAGLLKEAEELIESMPMVPEVATWGALLGACKKHGDNEMGERIGRKLIELQPDHDGFHVLLSNIYASKGNWHDVGEIRGMMTQNSVVKTPGCSAIEATGVVHEFLAGDRAHPRIHEIEEMLTEMSKRLKVMGYSPDTNEVSYDVDEEDKETALFRHSEKLAIAFGLIAISPPESIRIVKNLRICTDCHEAAKLVSMAFNREIIIRDRHRFHHFKDGSCSCKEYW
ncbi:pentatricopeptide repeat-containing protein At3g62890 isoform X2 [Daucus carota subsp. sativus]|uniref:pentatricopeptide repeat-containing protein At3g62890 isoform X2 n=1 Tax=Daucus carota subsp. sativus TaxID=79200 RepID=UPI0030828C66